MFRGALFSLATLSFACAPGTVAEDTLDTEVLPLHTHDLQAAPGCFVERASTRMSSGGGTATGVVSGGSVAFAELNASYNLQFMMLFNRLIQEDPTAERWELENRNVDGSGFHVRIDARSRSELLSHFEITLDSTTAVYGTFGTAQMVETTQHGYGTATPHSTTVDFGRTVYRWSDYAHEISAVMPVAVATDDGVYTTELRHISVLRGCDPNTMVSFGTYDGVVECWSVFGGMETSCERVNLWP